MDHPIVPKLVVCGTPKSGTSSVFHWLNAHPEICGPVRKELRFLMDQEDPLFHKGKNFHDHGIEGYADCFPNADKLQTKILLDATPHYIYQKTALDVLSQLSPQPHIVILLRNPTDRVLSSFRYTKFNLGLVPRKLTFDEYVNGVLSNDSTVQHQLRKLPVLLREVSDSSYVTHLRPWYEKFEEGRIHVFLFEEFVKDPLNHMQTLCESIGLDSSFYQAYEFPRVNESVAMRRSGLNWQALRFAKLLPKGKIKSFLKMAYLRFQGRNARQVVEQPVMAGQKKLDDYFEVYNQQLSELLGHDLAIWQRSMNTES